MSEINREDAIANVALAIWHYPNELYTSLNCFENCQELAERALNCLPSTKPEKVLVAEVKLSKEDIQSAVDEAVARIMAQLERKKGKWIYGEKSGQDGWYCSECGGFIPWYYDFYGLDNIDFIEDFKTCPFCDSKMVSYTGANMKEGDIK